MNVFIASVSNGVGTLTSEESWHCAKVLRARAGENVHIIDGAGHSYEGTLDLVSEKKCTVKITKGPLVHPVRTYYLHLAIAPTKQIDRIEWMIEKAVEIGVDEISFISCRNSERTVIKADRMLKIVESAVKQSLQATIPKVNELSTFKNIIGIQGWDQKLIAHCYDTPKKEIRAIDFKNKKNLVLIGPEGDFTMEEVQLASAANFESISLGTNRLRSETAGLYVCQAVSMLG